MNKFQRHSSWLPGLAFGLWALGFCCSVVMAQPVEPVLALAKKEQQAVLQTLKQLVEIESGSREIEGLNKIAEVIAGRLKALGGDIEMIEPGSDTVRVRDTPEKIGKMVRATFNGKGTRKLLLLAHMDTVYPAGMLAGQPFKIDGDRAWGLGIIDDRHGIAVILHSLAILKAMDFTDYGTLTILINGDEEIGSPASRHLITKLAAEHDAVLSYEGGGDIKTDRISLATSGLASAILSVRGRGAHAGVRPEAGVNALYELAHQVMQTRDLSDPKLGVKVNWTMARAGIVRNMIPPGAQAEADIRVERISDLDAVEQKLRERIKHKLLPEAEVELQFVRGRPAMQATDASRALAAHAQKIYSEIGNKLAVPTTPGGGGTDAAYAALKTKAPVIEGLGLRGYGAHSTDAEYVLISSIAPRLYLNVRLIMDLSSGKAPLK